MLHKNCCVLKIRIINQIYKKTDLEKIILWDLAVEHVYKGEIFIDFATITSLHIHTSVYNLKPPTTQGCLESVEWNTRIYDRCLCFPKILSH